MKQEVTSEITLEAVSKVDDCSSPPELVETTVNIESPNLVDEAVLVDESTSHKPDVHRDNHKYMSRAKPEMMRSTSFAQRPLKMRLRNNKRISHFNQFKIKQPQ